MADQSTPSNQNSAPAGIQIPQWAWGVALLLGIPISGGAGSMFGASQVEHDLQRVEERLVVLDDKLTEIRIAIAIAHGEDPKK